MGASLGCGDPGPAGLGKNLQRGAQSRDGLGLKGGGEALEELAPGADMLDDGRRAHADLGYPMSRPYKDAALLDENISRSASEEKCSRKDLMSSRVGCWKG